jgi:hypothetical protein
MRFVAPLSSTRETWTSQVARAHSRGRHRHRAATGTRRADRLPGRAQGVGSRQSRRAATSDPGTPPQRQAAAPSEALELFALGERLAWQARLPLVLIVCGPPAARCQPLGSPGMWHRSGATSLRSACEALTINPEVARDTLLVLAGFQAGADEAWRDAEPGEAEASFAATAAANVCAGRSRAAESEGVLPCCRSLCEYC